MRPAAITVAGGMLALVALVVPAASLAQAGPYLAMLLEWQLYADSDDLARVPHADPRPGAGIEAGYAFPHVGSMGVHGLLDLGTPVAAPFTPLEDSAGHRCGLRLRSPWLGTLKGTRPRFELSADRVHATARFLNDDYEADGWSLQVGAGLEVPLGEAFGLLVAVGYGWEDFGELVRADGVVATLPESATPLSLDREGWYLRVGIGGW